MGLSANESRPSSVEASQHIQTTPSLPFYDKDLTTRPCADRRNSAGSVETFIRGARLNVQGVYHSFQRVSDSAVTKWSTAKAHSRSVLDFLQGEPLLWQRLSIVGVAAFAGFISGYRRSRLVQLRNAAVLGGAAATICWPRETVDVSRRAFGVARQPFDGLWREYSPWGTFNSADKPGAVATVSTSNQAGKYGKFGCQIKTMHSNNIQQWQEEMHNVSTPAADCQTVIMPHCGDGIQRYGEKTRPPTWGRMKTSLTGKGVATATIMGTVAAGLFSRKHRTVWMASSGFLATVSVVFFQAYKNHEHKAKSKAVPQCTTIFDSFRFDPHPLCAVPYKGNNLPFYLNEPVKPVDPNDPWLKNIPYDNVPKPDCCHGSKTPEQVTTTTINGDSTRPPFQSNQYKTTPKDGWCLE